MVDLRFIDGRQPVTCRRTETYWIAEDNATVIGDVHLGDEDTSVWFGAVLRGDNEPITDRCKDEYSGSVPDPYRPRLSLPISARAAQSATEAILHGCKVGGRIPLIGMGAILAQWRESRPRIALSVLARFDPGKQGNPRQFACSRQSRAG